MSDNRTRDRRHLDLGRPARVKRNLGGEWLVLVGAVAVLVISAVSLSQTLELRGLRVTDAAESTLTNCQATESIKRQIRGVIVEAGRKRGSEEQQRAREKAIARFSATDCYALPIVRAAGLRRPAARK